MRPSVSASRGRCSGRILAAAGPLRPGLRQRLPLRKGRLIVLAWALVPRRFKLLAYGVVAAWLVVAVAMFAVLAAVFAQLG